jgi:transcriptional regulator with GAF, ATPase, and Fis domain
MQILQVKLIWLLGTGSLLIILLKIDFSSRPAGNQIAIKLITGLLMIASGAAIGILSRLGLLGQWLLSSGVSFYLETLFGYLIGWIMLLWGVAEWSKERREKLDEPLSKLRLRLFTERISPIVLKEHSTNSFMDAISKYLLLALDSQAIILHKRDSFGNLSLIFQKGLLLESEEILRSPQKNSLFYEVCTTKEIMVSDTSSDLNSIVRIKAKNCVIESGLSLPLFTENDISAVLTVLSSRQYKYSEDELNILEMVKAAMTTILKTEKTEHDLFQESGFRELTRLIAIPFDSDAPLLSALLDSARAAHAHLPFDELNLYISANGCVKTHDFALSVGCKVNHIEGHFNKTDYPQLFTESNDNGVSPIPERNATVIRFDTRDRYRVWLEIRLENSPTYLPDLLSVWSQLISRKIGLDHLDQARQQTTQWLGAIRHYHERALTTDNVGTLLQEMASLVIDLGMATYCRISLADPQKQNLRTAALAQVRPLDWPDTSDLISTSKLELHKQVLNTRKSLEFDQSDSSGKIADPEADIILPKGIQHGIMLPLVIDDESVGIVTFGEFRGRDREPVPALAELFASNLSTMISIVLSWHKEKRVSQEIIEGKKRLTIIQKEPAQSPTPDLEPTFKSRLNGPLAGIMASCEYLQKSHPDLEQEVGRYINIIERNAAKIHEIAAGTVAKS